MKRYGFSGETGVAFEDVDGEWIRYEDHCEAMKRVAGGGVDAAAFIERKAEDYAREFGTNDMGSLSFGNEDMRIYHWHLVELADEIRALAAPSASAQQAEPVAIPCWVDMMTAAVPAWDKLLAHRGMKVANVQTDRVKHYMIGCIERHSLYTPEVFEPIHYIVYVDGATKEDAPYLTSTDIFDLAKKRDELRREYANCTYEVIPVAELEGYAAPAPTASPAVPVAWLQTLNGAEPLLFLHSEGWAPPKIEGSSYEWRALGFIGAAPAALTDEREAKYAVQAVSQLCDEIKQALDIIDKRHGACGATEAIHDKADAIVSILRAALLAASPDDQGEDACVIPAGWKIAPDEEGWSVKSPSGDGCYLFDNDRLHGQTMEGAAVREVLRQLCSSLVYPDAAMSATPPAAEPLDDVCDCENVVHHCRDLPNCEPKMRMRRAEGSTR